MADHQARASDRESRRRALALATALLLLERRARRALAASLAIPVLHLAPLQAEPWMIERSMAAVGAQAIVKIRQAAAQRARAAWESLTGRDAAETESRGILEASRATDSATALATAWRKRLEEEREAAGGSPPRAGGARHAPQAERRALDDIAPNIRRTATTETVDAWADETVRQNDRAWALGLEVSETWVALLDACPKCWSLDGDTVTRPARFDDYPPLHPHCCCAIVSTIDLRKVA